MKKTLLLSVVASTMIMAGGDIAPVEPVIVEEVSAWEFGGQAVAYTQTIDDQGLGDLFAGSSTYGALGLQLSAVNTDILYGFGAGVELSAIRQSDKYSQNYTGGNAQTQSGGFTQAYLTYGMDSINTSVKVGRQTLPKALSPFAFSEGWQVFKNTFDAALVVNTSIPDTALVYAYVTRSNRSVGQLDNFQDISAFGSGAVPANDNVHMLTASNQSIDALTLTGSYYFAANMTSDASVLLGGLTGNPLFRGGDTQIWWIDAKYKTDMFTIAGQGGQVKPDGLDDTTAWGAKIGGNLGMFGLSAAYSSVDDGAVPVYNMGTNVKTPLYTQSVLDQNTISLDSDTVKLSATMKALGGGFGLHYIYSDLGDAARSSVFNNGNGLFPAGSGDYTEVDFTYKAKVFENTTVFAAYVYQDDDRLVDSQNFVRFWARYNFN